MSNLGALTVSLGLDAADYTRGLTQAEREGREFGEKIGTALRKTAIEAYSFVKAMDLAGEAVQFLGRQIDQIANYQGIADKIGDDAAAVQSLKLAADLSETSLDKIATASVKLTAELSKTSDQSKGAGAALKALGIGLDEFKALTPVEQLKKAAQALSGFADDSGKTAVQTALLGKSAGDLSGFLKDLAEAGETNVKLTNEQIGAIDEHQKAQARLRSEVESIAQLFAVQSVDSLTAFTRTVKTAIDDVLGLTKEAGNLADSRGVQTFAENTGRALAGAIDYVRQSVNEFRVLVDFVSSSAAAMQKVASFDFEGAAKVGKDFRDRYGLDELGRKVAGAGQAAGKTYVQQFNEQLAGLARSRFAAADPRRLDLDKPSLQGAKLGGDKKGGKVKNTAAQEAKAQLGLDLEEIRAALDGQVDAYRNAERLLAAERSAGLKSEDEYYAERIKLVQQTTAAQEAAARDSIARLEQEKLTGKDAIDNAKKIAVEQARLAKAQADGATTVSVLGIESEAAGKRITSAYLSAQQAAQDFFDTTNRGYARELAGMGQGQQQRDYTGGLQQIEERYQQQRQALQNARDLAELKGPLGAKEAKFFDDELALNRQYQEKSLESYKTYYEARKALERDWTVGAGEALHNYADEAANVAKQIEDAFTSGFKGLEDALVKFVTTGKADFKSLADSIIADIARMVIKQNITGPLAQALSGLFNFSTPLSTPMGITQIVGMGSPTAGILQLLAGARASGGPVQAGGLYQVNERGPELLDVDGKQLLMMGSKGGRVVANNRLGVADGGGTVVINQTVGDVATLSMLKQAQAITQRQAAAALQRSQRYGGALAA